jgi:hypothetical protein
MGKYISLAAFFLIVTPVHAGELNDMEAESINLGSYRGVVFYTNEQDGYHVVATISEGESGQPVRFEATITDTQKLMISVPGKLGQPSQVLEMSRASNKLVVAQPPVSDELKIAEEAVSND